MGILRLWLATLVLFNPNHIGIGVFNSWIFSKSAVLGFFVISGFYLQQIILHTPKHKPWLMRFYTSRALRVFPAYWLIMLITFAFFMISPAHYGPPGNRLASAVFHHGDMLSILAYIMTNISILGQAFLRWLVFDPAAGTFVTPVSHRAYVFTLAGVHSLFIDQAWTLVFELWFYLFVPILCTVSLRKQCGFFILFVCLHLELTQYIWVAGGKPKVQRDLVMFLPYFLAGALAFRLYNEYLIHRISRANKALIVQSCLAAIFMIGIADRHIMAWIPEEHALFLFVLLVTVSVPFIDEYFNRVSYDRFMGWISYPMYLCHLWMAQLVTYQITPDKRFIGILTWILSFLLSIVVVKYVEMPITRYRHRLIHTST